MSDSHQPFLRTIGLMLTYKCTISCPHCIVEAGPHRKEEMKLDDALNWVSEARKYKDGYIMGLALTGGEPFYNLPNLVKISNFADNNGFVVSGVTNAFWAVSKEKADTTLRKVPAIRAFGFSTDVYHQRNIPIEYVENAVWAAKVNHRLYTIAVCTDNKENLEFIRTIKRLREMGEEENIRVTYIFPVGRAQTCKLSHKTSCEPEAGACDMAGAPIIFPDGKVIACIGPVITLPAGHPLFLGDLHDEPLSSILDRADLNPILQIIRVWGPKKIFLLLKEHNYDELLPKSYIEGSICDCCYKLLSDKRIIDVLENIIVDKKLIELTAYGRLQYFEEPTMAIRLGLIK